MESLQSLVGPAVSVAGSPASAGCDTLAGMVKRRITYRDEPLGPLKIVPDFLPRPVKPKKRTVRAPSLPEDFLSDRDVTPAEERPVEPDTELRWLGGTMRLRVMTEPDAEEEIVEFTHRELSDRDAAALVAALLDDAPRLPRLIKAATAYLRRVDKSQC